MVGISTETDGETLARTLLKLRTALSTALIALAEIEKTETLEEARSRAQGARRAARAHLAGVLGDRAD